MREAAADPAIRVRLAAADVALLAAWCSDDVEQHDDTRRLWIVALELCRHTDHPNSPRSKVTPGTCSPPLSPTLRFG
ncbi:MAG: hypothetical protein LC799_35035, partial [Actinobacteria bacterium]|nr:hypothetical protein [Actinomycetota bacterium]